MDDNRLVKNVVIGIVEGQYRRGRQSREGVDGRVRREISLIYHVVCITIIS